MPDANWWALARSEEVTSKKPLAVDLGDQPIVLWRDKQGLARALEDRCPHRRAPLSLGCIRENGWIQCGYHGWSYDGATGKLAEIPNLKGDQRFPPLYRANAFAVVESDGLVRVNRGTSAPEPAADAAVMKLSGTAHVALDHQRYLSALYDEPGLLIAIRGVVFTPYLMSELRLEEGWLVMERSCQWVFPRAPSPFSSNFPLLLETRTHAATGETQLTLRDGATRELLHAIMAPVPAARGVTAIRWRCRSGDGRTGLRAKTLSFKVLQSIDAAALRRCKPSVSSRGEDLGDAAATAA